MDVKKHQFRLLLLAAIFVNSPRVVAEDVPPASNRAASQAVPAENQPHSFRLEELEAMALAQNPTIAQAIAAIDQARGTMIQSGLYPNPQTGYLRSDGSRSGTARTDAAFFGQEIVTAGKLKKSRAVEEQEVNRLTWQYHAQVQRVTNDVRIRYYDVLGADSSLRLVNRLVKTAEDGLKLTEKLHEARQVNRADLLQARIQHNSIRLTLREAEIRSRTAWKQLANVVGTPDLAQAPLEGRIDGEIPVREFEVCYLELLSGSPQLRSAETRIQHAKNELVREQAQPFPNVNVQVIAERDHVQQFNSVSTFLSVPLPLLNRNQGNIQHAAADIHEACAEVERTRLALRDQLADAFQRYESARAQVESLRDEILPDARENVDVTMTGYKAGEVSALQVLASRQTYFESSLTYVNSWTELRKVVAEIDGLLLTGALNPAELGSALQATGGGFRQRGLLNQMQDRSSTGTLPAAIQAGGTGGP